MPVLGSVWRVYSACALKAELSRGPVSISAIKKFSTYSGKTTYKHHHVRRRRQGEGAQQDLAQAERGPGGAALPVQEGQGAPRGDVQAGDGGQGEDDRDARGGDRRLVGRVGGIQGSGGGTQAHGGGARGRGEGAQGPGGGAQEGVGVAEAGECQLQAEDGGTAKGAPGCVRQGRLSLPRHAGPGSRRVEEIFQY